MSSRYRDRTASDGSHLIHDIKPLYTSTLQCRMALRLGRNRSGHVIMDVHSLNFWTYNPFAQ